METAGDTSHHLVHGDRSDTSQDLCVDMHCCKPFMRARVCVQWVQVDTFSFCLHLLLLSEEANPWMVYHRVTSESFSTAQIPWDVGKHREEDPGVKREIGRGGTGPEEVGERMYTSISYHGNTSAALTNCIPTFVSTSLAEATGGGVSLLRFSLLLSLSSVRS